MTDPTGNAILNQDPIMEMLKVKTVIAVGLFLFTANLFTGNLHAEVKVDRNVSYGTHERNVMDIYWNTQYKNAPIVFTIHGGAFKNGSKAYCSKDKRDLYMAKGCIVVSPNYRLKKEGTSITKDDCALDVAMAVAYIQANAKKYGGDPKKIVATGASAGGYISAQIAYSKKWDWPADAKYKPEQLNIVGWFGNSPYLPRSVIRKVSDKDAPGFIMYGGEKEHPATPARQGYDMQAALTAKQIWSKMVYIDAMGHVPGRRVLFSPRTRDKETYEAFNQFLDLVCYGKGKPKGGDVIKVK
ncbi:alpha/beta hydrolase [bacterium]|nr:alpha/beta hydrolase [bacterium]MDC0265662.1 alpha/beta hydrolase [Mariniblastus sp.]